MDGEAERTLTAPLRYHESITAMETPKKTSTKKPAGETSNAKKKAWSQRTPTIWHGMSLPAWWRLLRSENFAVSRSKTRRVLSITHASIHNITLNAATRAVYGRRIARATFAQPPIFVIGHWRSGTTLMHELLAADPRHTAPNNYQVYTPGHFLLTERILAPLVARVLPETRPQDAVPFLMTSPQEDEFALMAMGQLSPQISLGFPDTKDEHLEYFDLRTLTPEAKKRWIDAWLYFLKSLVVANPGRRLVLKSPIHTARVKTILEVFPDARFVHITRHPEKLYPSTVHTLLSLIASQGLQDLPANYEEEVGHRVIRNLTMMYDAFEQDRAMVPAGHLVDVHYEEFVRDPAGHLRTLYTALDLGDFTEAESAIAPLLERSREYKTNSYAPPAGLAERLAKAWPRYYERYGYEPTVPRPQALAAE